MEDGMSAEHDGRTNCDGCELDLAHEKCMAEFSALTAERDQLKAWNDELERISNERSKTIDRILSDRNGLEERVKELEEQRSALEKAVPCPECGKNALFVCSLGALNCANCGDHIGWDALAKGEKP